MAEYDVVLLPGYAQVETWRKTHAELSECGLFAQAVTTFDDWIRDLWELHGDGRVLVDAAQRQVAMQIAFDARVSKGASGARAAFSALHGGVAQGENASSARNTYGSGEALLAARCMKKAAGVSLFEEALSEVSATGSCNGLSAAEVAFVERMARYSNLIAERGLIELGAAVRILADKNAEVFPRPLEVLVSDAAPLSWIQRQFFDSCPQLKVDVQYAQGQQGIGCAPASTAVRFGFPSGRLAQPGLVADILRSWSERDLPAQRSASVSGKAVIACKDPLRLFREIGSACVEEGLCMRAQGKVPFGQTDFGREFLAMYRAVHDEPWDPRAVQDVIATPFGCLSRQDAQAVDTMIRSDRIVERDSLLPWLRVQSELFSQLEEIASDPEADVLLGVFENIALARAAQDPTWCAEQLAAISALRGVTGAARFFQADMALCVATLERASVPVSVQVGDPSSRQVTCMPQEMAAQLGAQSCGLVVATDLTSADYPLSSKDDASDTLFSKIGLEDVDSPLAKARRTFVALVGVAADDLFLVRPLADDDAAETYPATVLEEFIDAYRPDPSATDDIDNALRLPASLQGGVVERGEEFLYANATAKRRSRHQEVCAQLAWPEPSSLREGAAYDFTPRRKASDGTLLSLPCPSPSQVEAYLECPYRWYATRYLAATSVDEGFGPLERGSFAHEALEEFYRRFNQAGHPKVNAENLPEARELMAEIVGRIAAEQPQREPGSGRYVPNTELEAREVAALSRQLVNYLDFEAQLLPTFHPAYLEYSIDSDHAVPYGDALLVGTVDRIDVDDAGHAVIIDYKGSVNVSHQIAGKTFDVPGKVQALMYAQAIKRQLGLDVVGALYVSYGASPSIAGAFDARVLEAAHLPNAKVDKCRCAAAADPSITLGADTLLADLPFTDVLDAVERRAAEAVRSMTAARVPLVPSNASACTYCPVETCPKRGA